MKKILVVFTGGTISCKTAGAVMSATAGVPYVLIRQYLRETGEDSFFTTASPLTILSENLVPDDWKTMADCIRKTITPDTAGVIVTHGTDTLAYTAAALSFMLEGLPVPVVLTASDRPPDDERSNAAANFAAAVEFIRGERLPGVYVIFRQNGELPVFLGTRLCQAALYTHRFASVTGEPLGWMVEGCFHPQPHRSNPTVEELRAVPEHPLPVFPDLRGCIQYIRPYPGMDYKRLSLPGSVRAVFHGLYHSGTACVRDGLSAFVESCRGEGREVFAAPVWFSEAEYASVRVIRDSGIRLLPPMAEEAAYVKLLLAYTLFPDDEEARREYLERNVAFERLSG